MDNKEVGSNIPKDISPYRGQYIIFFSEEEDPQVIFNSPVAEEAHQKAKEIEKEQGRSPIVIRVSESSTDNISQVLSTRS